MSRELDHAIWLARCAHHEVDWDQDWTVDRLRRAVVEAGSMARSVDQKLVEVAVKHGLEAIDAEEKRWPKFEDDTWRERFVKAVLERIDAQYTCELKRYQLSSRICEIECECWTFLDAVKHIEELITHSGDKGTFKFEIRTQDGDLFCGWYSV